MSLRVLVVDNGQCFMKPLRDMAPLVQTIRNLGIPG